MLRRIIFAIPLLASALARAEAPAPGVVERYRQMLAANPAEGTALDRLWEAFSEQGKTAELIDEYAGAKTFASEMVLGHLLRKALRPAEAMAAFQRAGALDAQSPLPPLALGHLEKAEGRHAESAKWLARAVELLATDEVRRTDTLMELGGEWLAAGDGEKAAAAWEKTVELDPQNLELRRRLAESYVRQHLGERAIPHLEFLVANAPPQDGALALQQLAGIEQGRGRQDAAIVALDRALALTAPGNWLRADLQSQLIRLYQRYHRTPELELRWKKFAAENPRDLGAYLQLVDLYERLGDHPQELAWLEKLTALAPKRSEYRLRLARLFVQMDQLGRAGAVYDELLAAQPANAELVFERSRLDVQRDQPQAAGERVAALLARSKGEESVRGKALEFYEANRLFELEEKQLVEDAKSNAEEPVLALANFYFTRRREGDARRVLQRLIRADATPPQRAAAHLKVAQVLKGQNEVDEAVTAARAAIALQPDVREYFFLLGELEAGRGRYVDAQQAFERAVVLSGTPVEAQEADQRLYESLRNQRKPEEEDQRPTSPGLIRMESTGATSAAAQGYLLNLLRLAVEQPTEERWLRVARWQMWSRNSRGAIDAAGRVLALNPGSVAANDFLAKLHGADPQAPATQKHLRELMRLDPANRLVYLRRLGQSELQAGRLEESQQIFAEIAEANPGGVEGLTDLALAQQRAGKWMDALATLKKVHALCPPARRREIVNALLRVYDRLAMHEDAAALLVEQIDSAADNKDRFSLFQDLLTHCTHHSLLDWLRKRFDARRKLFADDYFTEVALGRILKAQGNKAAAFEVLADAALSAPNPGEALPELVHEAEELRKLDAAIELQTRLVRIVPQNGPEGFERLAQLREKNLQPEEAAKVWERIVARFPRELGVLERGVEFQRKWGAPTRALEWLRRIRQLDPSHVRALGELATLALESGQAVEAESALEQILVHTDPEPAGSPVRFPGVKTDDSSRLQATYLATVRQRRGRPTAEAMRALRGFWLEDPPEAAPAGDRDVRQRAIRDLGALIAAKNDPKALALWTARWRAASAQASEKLLALYAAGATDALLDEVEALLAAKPADPQATNAFIWLALQSGEFERLGTWLQDRRRTTAERDYLIVAIERYLEAHDDRIDPTLIARLFPNGFRARLWQLAQRFGQRGLFREATELGQRVFDGLTTQRAGFGLELANWYLNIGELDRARDVLRRSVENVGESFDAPVYGTLRALYLLLPESERARFATDYARTLDEQTHPLHSAIARSLLAALGGDEKAARSELQRVLDLRAVAPTVTAVTDDERVLSAARFWNFILNAGVQLETWHLDSLARFLWERALEDPAWISLQAQTQGRLVQERALEVRTRLTALILAHAEPWEFDETLDEFTRTSPPDTVLVLAEALESAGANPRAIEIYRRLWEREPENPHALRNLLNACRTGDDLATMEQVLTRSVEEGHFRASDATQRDLIYQLVDLLEKRKDFEPARRILTGLVEVAPRDSRLGLRLGLLLERAGQRAPAEAAYRRVLEVEPSNSTARLALAATLDAAGQTAAAITVLEQSSGADVDARLADLYFKVGRLDESVAAIDRVPAPGHVAATLAVVNGLAANGEIREAQIILRGELSRSTDAETNFPLQSRMVELLDPASGAAIAAREIRRLRQMAAGDQELLSAYFDLVEREAPRLKIEAEFARELTETWEEGRGPLLGGAALLDWQLHHDGPAAAAATWAQLRARSDLNEVIAERVAVVFRTVKDDVHEAEALASLARLDASTPNRLVDLAKALDRQKRHDEVLKVLDELAARAVFHDDVAPSAARACAEFGASDRARELFAHAVSGDPAARDFSVHLDYVRLLMSRGEWNVATSVLRRAFRNPAARDVGLLVACLAGSGRIEDADAELPSFSLTPQMLVAARRAIFGELEKSGRIVPGMRLLDEHPEIFEPGMSGRIRVAAKTAGAFAGASALLERIVAQSPLEGAEPANELALLLIGWADAEPGDVSLAHLKRAFELRPDLWDAAERLSRLSAERGDMKRAAQTLRAFISASKNAAEQEMAKQALSRLPAS